jgi:hypothetical protein
LASAHAVLERDDERGDVVDLEARGERRSGTSRPGLDHVAERAGERERFDHGPVARNQRSAPLVELELPQPDVEHNGGRAR